MTTLAFRSKPGAESIPPNSSKLIRDIDVSQYSRIRIFVDPGSRGIGVRLVVCDGKQEVFALDDFILPRHAKETRLYDLPGTKLRVYVIALEPVGNHDDFDLIVWGA